MPLCLVCVIMHQYFNDSYYLVRSDRENILLQMLELWTWMNIMAGKTGTMNKITFKLTSALYAGIESN